ncbi:MAG: hypothetical protein NWE89_15280, partial [Candidatus Bathyarchaeota archaeon]|nr:hypothetical protein [Candidatus Bathyarchaeota archaeon]
MSISIMNYMIEGAGDIERLYYAVRTANETKTEDTKKQWDYFINNFSSQIIYEKKRKLKSPRSVERYFSLARELGFLRQKDQTRTWYITESYGKAFLDLYESDKKPAKYLVLTQFIKNDRSFLIPYLKYLLQNDNLNSIKKENKIIIIDKTW